VTLCGFSSRCRWSARQMKRRTAPPLEEEEEKEKEKEKERWDQV
jgi:hypothetical protein